MINPIVNDNAIEDNNSIIERFTEKWLSDYRLKLDKISDVSDYFALVISVSVFRDLIMTQFRHDLEKDSLESVDVICDAISDHAAKMAQAIDRRVALKTAN